MGKNSIIKSLGKVIGNLAVHKATLKFGDKPESEHHTSSEIVSYRNNGKYLGSGYNWNKEDKKLIRNQAFKYFFKKMKKKYSHINFTINDANNIIDKSMNECIFIND